MPPPVPPGAELHPLQGWSVRLLQGRFVGRGRRLPMAVPVMRLQVSVRLGVLTPRLCMRLGWVGLRMGVAAGVAG